MTLPTLERERLLGGNWKIRPAAGLYFVAFVRRPSYRDHRLRRAGIRNPSR